MSLYVYGKDSDGWSRLHSDRDKYAVEFDSYENIQRQFCSRIELEVAGMTKFLDTPAVKDYLNRYGVVYKGGYIIESDKWDPKEQFVTYLHYVLQMSCLLLSIHSRSSKEIVGVLHTPGLFELKYILPVLEKMDIYVKVSFRNYNFWLIEVAKAGIEIFIEDVSVKDMDSRMLSGYLIDRKCEKTYLDRSTDAEYFMEDYADRIFTPYEMTYEEYIRKCMRNYIMKSNDVWIDMEKWTKDFEGSFKENTGMSPSDIWVIVNGRNDFDGSYRRYPIHYLYEMENGLKYIRENSVKNPDLDIIFYYAFFDDRRFAHEKQQWISTRDAKRVMILVLDCDEVCDVTEYWERVAFVAKYDKSTQIIEICDKEKGIYEFHKLLQNSIDLE